MVTDVKEGGAGVHIVTDIKVKGRNNLKGRNNSPTFPYKFSRKLNFRYSLPRISIFTTSDPCISICSLPRNPRHLYFHTNFPGSCKYL